MPAARTPRKASAQAKSPSPSSQRDESESTTPTTPSKSSSKANASKSSPEKSPRKPRAARPPAAALKAWKEYVASNKWAVDDQFEHPNDVPRKELACQKLAKVLDGARLQEWELAILPHEKAENERSAYRPQKLYAMSDVRRLIRLKIEHLGREAVYPPGSPTKLTYVCVPWPILPDVEPTYHDNCPWMCCCAGM